MLATNGFTSRGYGLLVAKMCEHLSVSPAAALREARRKKILENSGKRLKLIEQINSSSRNTETPSYTEPKPDSDVSTKKIINPDINSKVNDLLESNNELKQISDYLLQDDASSFEEDEEEETLKINRVKKKRKVGDVEVSTAEQQKENLYLHILIQKRLHYILLALIVNILFYFKAGYFFYENVFCPFYTMKAIELISKRGEKEDFKPVLLLFIASLPQNVQKYTKTIVNVVLVLFSDFCIYLFSFIIGYKIMTTLE